ncbi:hypothetical protein [Ralstonia pseudosolanacearum]|uniref:hypothetical protein n=1 Tax=Ralstonia pseudosolanacearum TaxID=1310165 RepID=UPI000693C245|nr:hypothetical protein [Ralstonia pseudosolanacearum]ANH34147.1 Polyprenyl-phosphate beta-D-glucosyltransferase [Ralstonia solanacearum]
MRSQSRGQHRAGRSQGFGRRRHFTPEGTTSLSTLALRSRTHIAPAVATLSFCNSTFSIARTLVSGVVVPGHASMLLCFGGPQSIGLGVVEYVARIDGEGRKRPVDQVKRRDPARQACASERASERASGKRIATLRRIVQSSC